MEIGKYTLITDIGSTTTKAILIDRDAIKLLSIAHADTTVESPHNDVKHGIWKALKSVEKQSGITLFAPGASSEKLDFAPGIQYYSTSSAGGGLQILVVGLTLFDSASSAKRAAYGAGGVILDVFTIDDKRSSSEQMLAMRNLRPDMILLCGGTDGGAISSVLRLAEILRIARPLPKFSTSVKIPTIYAGNNMVVDMVKSMISQDFDLHVLPNLRPKINTENLKPTQDRIQEIFMENVMERAPGYSSLKDIVSSAILPTPAAVMRSLNILAKERPLNTILFDIGGATTDVFTYINQHFQRTVSANLGMSYSALNILRESQINTIKALLPDSISEQDIRNYIGNKTLYPTSNPQSRNQYRIEHALAKCAVRHSYNQHQDMHYNTQKIGYLDAMKNTGKDKFEQKFNYVVNEQSYCFYPSDIGMVIGAGGVFAHAPSVMECADILIGGFQPVGITELAIDKHFVSPHLGVLSESDEASATSLLHTECLQSLAIHIRPIFPHKPGISVLQLSFDNGNRVVVSAGTLHFFPGKPGTKVTIDAMKKCQIDGILTKYDLETDLPIIVDTRFDLGTYDPQMERLFAHDSNETSDSIFENHASPHRGNFDYDVELPFKGDILAKVGDKVSPDDIVAQNRHNPPRLFVVDVNPDNITMDKDSARKAITVRIGEKVAFGHILREAIPHVGLKRTHVSPVRGKVEYVDYAAHLIVLSELQNYSEKPVHINLAEKMGLKPKQVRRFLCQSVGSFVFEGQSLAKNISPTKFSIVASPTTGQIVSYDDATSIITIRYISKPYLYHAHVSGTVSQVEESKALRITYEGFRLEAAIGWGKPQHGTLFWLSEYSGQAIPDNSIIACSFKPTIQELEEMATKVKGIICPSLHEADLAKFIGDEPGVINTGQETISASLILIQGFGDLALKEAQQSFLIQNQGKPCMLEPHTRIRAGVIRASISIIDS